MLTILDLSHAQEQAPQGLQEAPSVLSQAYWDDLGEDAPETALQPLPELDWDALGEDEPEVTPPESKSPAPVEGSPFLDALETRFGQSADDWAAILSAVRTAKVCEGEVPSDDGLTEITPFLFVGSRFRSEAPRQNPGEPLVDRDRFFKVLGLALDMGEISVKDLQETVLLDDANSRIVMRGIAVPVRRGSDGRTVWDTSLLKLEITSNMDPGAQPVNCGVRKTTNENYLLVDFTPIRRSLPRLYAKLDANGLFLRRDLHPFSKSTRTVLLHRLTLAAGGVNVAGMEGDHKDTSTGAHYGGPSTYDARLAVMQALTHEEHTVKTIERGERHFYTEGARAGGKASARRLAQDAAEGAAILREVFELGRRLKEAKGDAGGSRGG